MLMPELETIYQPGDYVYVRDHTGRIFVYITQHNGTVILVSEPAERTE